MPPSANSSRSNPKAPLLFVSTNYATFSDASRTAARSHAAAWSRRRLKEAKAKPKASEDVEHAAKIGQLPSSSESGTHQTLQHDSDTNDNSDRPSIRRQPEQQLSVSARPRRRDRVLDRREAPVNRRDSSSLPLVVCGKNGTLDPFDSLAVKVDANAYELLQFYKCSALAWNSHPFAPSQDSLGGDSSDIVDSCMSSKLHFYTFLCLSAAIMDVAGITQTNPSRTALYSHRALTEMQKQLRREHFNEQELLHGVSTLSIAAALQGDVVAARAHLQAARYLVNRLGGFEALTPLISQLIRYGDFHLAIETLCPPVFALNFEPEEFPEQDHSSDWILEQIGYDALQFSRGHRLPWLFENVQRTIQCAKILEGIWIQPTLSANERITWLVAKIGSTINRLMSTSINTTTDSHARRAQEATKVVLILWNLIALIFAQNVVANIPVRGSVPVFRDSALESMREDWPSWIYLGLMSWNEIVNSPPLECDNRGTIWSLINLVRSMEAESLVQLADLMHRLYQLEDIYLMQKQRRGDLELALR